MTQALARITPLMSGGLSGADTGIGDRSSRSSLTRLEKAAIIVRILLAEGAPIQISELPDHMQAALTEQIGSMRLVDRATMNAVVEEFLHELEQAGIAFPGGIDGALGMLDGHISATAASRLRRLAGASSKADPWEKIANLGVDRLLPALEAESVEVGAVMLSKLPVAMAAQLLGKLPGDKARRVAHAVSLTGNVDPETVRRIGLALTAQLDAQPPRAFESGPVERVGAILNVSAAETRDAVLAGLEADDAAFAEQVRRAIFTFTHIPARLPALDVPLVVRAVEQRVLVTALAGIELPQHRETADFLLGNLSQRLAESIREEVRERGKVRPRETEAAMAAIIEKIREMETKGEIRLVNEEDRE